MYGVDNYATLKLKRLKSKINGLLEDINLKIVKWFNILLVISTYIPIFAT